MAYPKPYGYFRYAIPVTRTGAGSYKTNFASTSVGPAVVYDNVNNGGGDSSAQLGDVSNDTYSVMFPNTGIKDSTSRYLGETSDGKSFVGRYVASGGRVYYYLYTNAKYANNKAFTTQNAPFTVCYAAGTAIRTIRGDIVVERLAVGDLAITASGAARPIRWLGHRPVDLARHSRPGDARPVRIAAHAFGENRPSADLLVSPGHSICVDVFGETLIPAVALVNGTTVTRVETDSVEYWHVELDDHDILIANGLPAESYLDMGNRDFFVENDVVAVGDVSPDADRRDPASRTHADFCRPFHVGGPILTAVRARIDARAAELARVERAA